MPKEGNPTLLRSIEQVSSICTIKSFLCLKVLFNIKLNSERRVWKKFVKKNKGAGQLRQELERYNGLSGMLGREPFSKHSQLFYIGIHKY